MANRKRKFTHFFHHPTSSSSSLSSSQGQEKSIISEASSSPRHQHDIFFSASQGVRSSALRWCCQVSQQDQPSASLIFLFVDDKPPGPNLKPPGKRLEERGLLGSTGGSAGWGSLLHLAGRTFVDAWEDPPSSIIGFHSGVTTGAGRTPCRILSSVSS